MAVLKVLAEVIGAEEFLSVVALAEFVDRCQVIEPAIPIWLWEVGEFLAAIAAGVVR